MVWKSPCFTKLLVCIFLSLWETSPKLRLWSGRAGAWWTSIPSSDFFDLRTTFCKNFVWKSSFVEDIKYVSQKWWKTFYLHFYSFTVWNQMNVSQYKPFFNRLQLSTWFARTSHNKLLALQFMLASIKDTHCVPTAENWRNHPSSTKHHASPSTLCPTISVILNLADPIN